MALLELQAEHVSYARHAQYMVYPKISTMELSISNVG